MSDILNTRGDALLSMLEQTSGQPLRAMIEVSDRCNEVCVHCYQEQGRKGEMTTEQIKSVMDELAAMGVLVLTISGGEATLRPDFLELIAHARKRSFAIRLFTNGLTMTRELAAELHQLAVHVVEISLYSHRADVHDFITGVPRSFERTTAGIRYLSELGVDVHVKSPMMAVNQDAIPELRAFAASLGATSFAADASRLMSREGEDRSPERLARSQAHYEEAFRSYEGGIGTAPPGAMPRTDLAASICGAGATVHIEPNGELRPCTMLDLKLGHALEGVAAARQHDNALLELRSLGWKDAHGCRSCDLAASCGRCFASALVEVGDALAPYPTACTNARSKYLLRTGAPVILIPTAYGTGETGPYRHVEGHRFEVVADEVTEADHDLAARLRWLRRERAASAAGPVARPGELIQLRRPGSKRARPLQVPAAQASLSATQMAAEVSSAILGSALDSERSHTSA